MMERVCDGSTLRLCDFCNKTTQFDDETARRA
jgi:hypothetical protein